MLDRCDPAVMNLVAKGVGATLEFDGSVVTITQRGALGRLSVGKGTKRIPVHQLTAIQWKEPGWVVSGFIQFTIAGGVERRSQFGRQTLDASRDENSVLFTRLEKVEFLRIREAIEDAMTYGPQTDRVAEVSPRPMPPAAGHAADRMVQLQRMLHDGLITPTEYDLKRQEILRQL